MTIRQGKLERENAAILQKWLDLKTDVALAV